MTENVFLNLIGSFGSGDRRNANEIMTELGSKHDFKIVSATPQSIADGWQFTIEYEHRPSLPKFISRDLAPYER